MKTVLLLIFGFLAASTANNARLQRIVELVNNADVPWQAELNHFHTDDHKKLMGTFRHPNSAVDGDGLIDGGVDGAGDCETNGKHDDGDDQTNAYPEYFDARYHWFDCPSISHIWNQGNCAADWAIAATSVMNDRICIESQGNITALYSPQKVVSCCQECGNGCKGGYTAAAWKYILKRGIVTGGEYGSDEGCQPWLVPPCANVSSEAFPGSMLGPRGLCGADEAPPITPKCDLSCYNAKYDGSSYSDDIIKAKKVFSFDGCTARKILKKHGPYVATMRVYEDFLTYKTGVYRHVTGDYLGMLSVRMIGWGLQRGEAYWLLANSWGTSWGEKGFFKIRRYVNECWIENFRYAGIPQL